MAQTSVIWKTLAWASLVVAAGVFHGASWTFPGWWPGAWVGQCLVIVIAVLYRPSAAFLSGIAIGCIGIGWAFSWAPAALQLTLDASSWGSRGVYAGLVLWESCVFGIFCGLTSYFARRKMIGLAMAPMAWVVAECWWPRIFPWLLGYSQLDVVPLIQVAEFTGSCGIGFAMTGLATIPAAWMIARRTWDEPNARRRFLQYSATVAGLFALVLGVGIWRLDHWRQQIAHAPERRVGLIQVDPGKVGSEAKLRDFTFKLKKDVDLVCWPESAIGSYSTELSDFTDVDRTLINSRNSRESVRPAQGFQCDLLAGGKLYRPGVPEEGPYSMTAFLINPSEQIIGRYLKRTLLPFGEYMPGQKQFPRLREWATLYEVIEAGQDAKPLVTSRGDRLGVVICYEDMLRSNVHATVSAGAEILFSLIHGSAFECPLTLEQHKRLAQMRAVEHRRFLVRCSSTGVTCVISPTGEIVDQLDHGIEATLECPVRLLQDKTLYTRWGEFFPWSCTLLVLIGLSKTSVAKPERSAMT